MIVVDDGSTDGSQAVMQGYEDRVTLVMKENGGQASAFNAGVERCEGDVVIFLDADDILNPRPPPGPPPRSPPTRRWSRCSCGRR